VAVARPGGVSVCFVVAFLLAVPVTHGSVDPMVSGRDGVTGTLALM
jgi:hypothetical protein